MGRPRAGAGSEPPGRGLCFPPWTLAFFCGLGFPSRSTRLGAWALRAAALPGEAAAPAAMAPQVLTSEIPKATEPHHDAGDGR